jgi:hypothetical protein
MDTTNGAKEMDKQMEEFNKKREQAWAEARKVWEYIDPRFFN